jgi:hypothetical protein
LNGNQTFYRILAFDSSGFNPDYTPPYYKLALTFQPFVNHLLFSWAVLGFWVETPKGHSNRWRNKKTKHIYGLLVSLGLLSCVSQSNSGPAPTKSSATLLPSQLTTPTVGTRMASASPIQYPNAIDASLKPNSASPSTPSPEPIHTACPLIRADNPPRLDYPQDVAVSGDGKTLYVTSRPCSDLFDGQTIVKLDPSSTHTDCGNRLYQLSESKLSAFKGQYIRNTGFSCHLADIEMDRQKNVLYAGDTSRPAIVRFDLNTHSSGFVADLIQPSTPRSDILPPQSSLLSGPFYLYWDPGSTRLFFQMIDSYNPWENGVEQVVYGNSYKTVHLTSKIPSPIAFFNDYMYTPHFKSSRPINLNKIEDFADPIKDNTDFPNFLKTNALNLQDRGIRIDSKENLYLSDIRRHVIWKYDFSKKEISIFAGFGKPGYRDGQGMVAQFNYPTALDVDHYNNLYVADTGNHAIRKITPDGMVSTVYKAPES